MDIKGASRRRRFFGWIFDFFIFTMLMSIMFFLFPVFTEMENAKSISDVPLLFYFLFIVFSGIYLLRDSVAGTSPGKYLLGMAVRDNKDQSKTPSFGRLVARNLALLIWPLECLVIIFSSEKRRIGDRMTDSTVVQIAPTKKLFVALSIPLVIASFMASISLGIKKSGAYQVATDFLSTNEKIKERVGEVTGFGMFPGGEVKTENGYGEAVIGISIHGSKTNVDAQILLTKEPDAPWVVKDFKFE